MRLETFFEKFDLLADAPDAVPRLRSLVLDLAATGRLFAGGGDWTKHALKHLTTKIGSGATPDGGREAYVSSGTPLIRSMNVYFEGFRKAGLVYLTPEQADGLANVVVQADDVLLNITGASIGRVTTAPADMAGARVNQHVAIIRPKPALHSRFLAIILASPSFQRLIDEIQVGATRQALTKAMIEQFEIPVPAIQDQKRIVAKVDELMALCDRLEAQQQERQTRHAALARASLARFADAPTPANLSLLFHKTRDIESSELRKLILSLAVQGRIVPFPGCCSETLGHHVEFLNGFAFKSEWFRPSGVRLCRNANVGHGALDWKESAFVEESVALEFGRFALSEGDLVLSLDRPLISTGLKVARVTAADLPCLLLQRVAKPMPKHDDVDLDFLMLWFNSSEFIDSIDPGRSNGVPHISTKQVMALPFTLPPLKVQRQVVATTNALLRKVEMLELQVASARNVSATLMGAVVNELTATA